jgi:hypothetical protein
MESLSKVTGAILVVAVLGLAGYTFLTAGSDRAKFDELRIGMSFEEVQGIVGRTATTCVYTEVDDHETLTINDVMVLTFRGGRLVDKKWLNKEKGP